MSTSIILLPIVILLLLAILSIPILLGIFVYRDAKSRGMEPLLWTLIVVLAPSFLGLIIYLIVRKDNIIMKCPTCDGEVQEHFTTCPGCGQKLKAGCPNCGTALKPEWKICPQCGREITEVADFTPPVPNKGKSNKGLVGVIVSILLIPVIMILLISLGAIGTFVINTAGAVEQTISSEDVLSDFTTATEVSLFNLMEADDVKILTDDNKKWINEKLEGDDGIYSTTVYETESGGFTSVDNDYSGSYQLTYAYTIVVINPIDGKACNFVNANYSYDGDSLFVLEPSIMFNEVDSTNADEYKNVFVIKHVYDYNIDAFYQDDSISLSTSDLYVEHEITINISTEKGSYDYIIPVNEKSTFIAFEQK